jgi:hypothetical protein
MGPTKGFSSEFGQILGIKKPGKIRALGAK